LDKGGALNKPSKESKRHVEAVLKAFSILEFFEAGSTLSLRQISEETGLNKSRIMRLCGSLISMGYLQYGPETGSYQLGAKILSLANLYKRHNSILSVGRPVLRELVEQTGETATLSKRVDTHRVGLLWEDGLHPVRFASNTEGKILRLSVGSAGKVLLAYSPEEIVEQVLNLPEFSRPLTRQSICDPDLFREELSRTRQRGYGSSFGERTDGSASLSAPVRDSSGRVCSAMSVIGPIQRFSDGQHEKYLPALLEKADKLSRLLGAPGKE
jgi:DNA-binding IclR family transcriptional regulator